MEDILTVKELSKTYRNGRKALDNLNFGKLQVQVSHPDKPVSACCN